MKLATLVSRPHVRAGHTFTEPANSYDIIHGHYSITWPPVYLESWSRFHILCYVVCICSTSLYWPTYSFIIFVSTVHGPKSSFISRPTRCPLNLHRFSKSMDNALESSSGNWLLYLKSLFSDRVMYLLSNWTNFFCTLNCTFAQVKMHSSIFIVSSGFHKLAPVHAGRLWMAPNVANIDRFHCIFISMYKSALEVNMGLYTLLETIDIRSLFIWKLE